MKNKAKYSITSSPVHNCHCEGKCKVSIHTVPIKEALTLLFLYMFSIFIVLFHYHLSPLYPLLLCHFWCAHSLPSPPCVCLLFVCAAHIFPQPFESKLQTFYFFIPLYFSVCFLRIRTFFYITTVLLSKLRNLMLIQYHYLYLN